ncbi:hypothetical protein H920_01270 [Fukomys damarensis]|uniref:Uncharacterized protein n=1 Tax=Fukomys damarensis TaxID=885580 RepID=A0A091E3L7_FUKDA|nr:hypothetical protein H920_01270 [Fukomys damarensis]
MSLSTCTTLHLLTSSVAEIAAGTYSSPISAQQMSVILQQQLIFTQHILTHRSTRCLLPCGWARQQGKESRRFAFSLFPNCTGEISQDPALASVTSALILQALWPHLQDPGFQEKECSWPDTEMMLSPNQSVSAGKYVKTRNHEPVPWIGQFPKNISLWGADEAPLGSGTPYTKAQLKFCLPSELRGCHIITVPQRDEHGSW